MAYKEIFEFKAILAASVLGAIVFLFVNTVSEDPVASSNTKAITYGAIVGAGVQIGVRLIGVS